MNLGAMIAAVVLFREVLKEAPGVPTPEELKGFLGGWGL